MKRVAKFKPVVEYETLDLEEVLWVTFSAKEKLLKKFIIQHYELKRKTIYGKRGKKEMLYNFRHYGRGLTLREWLPFEKALEAIKKKWEAQYV